MNHEPGKYVYCILRSPKPLEFGRIGIGDEPGLVHTVHFGELAAVVSDTPVRLYDATRENVLTHEFVNETVMREHTVVPMSFGTLFRTGDDVVELLRSTYATLDDVLEKVRDKVEFGLKVLWDRERVTAALERDDEEIRSLREEIGRSAHGSTYFARMQLGRRMETALETAGNAYVREIHEALRPVAVASRSSRPIGDRMILNTAFLVERDREATFDAQVQAIADRYEDLLTIRYTGPWPPYNFVNVRLKLEKPTDR